MYTDLRKADMGAANCRIKYVGNIQKGCFFNWAGTFKLETQHMKARSSQKE
jgi:hypothetical protein